MRQFSPNGTSRPGDVKGILARLLKRGGATITTLGLLTIGALIAGCGGGGSGDGAAGPAVTGVAATGSPMVGTVTLRDSSSVRKDTTADIHDDGSFVINISGMTAPFILKATGTADGVSRTLFSFADRPGIANINPLSNAAVANAAGVDDPNELFDKSDAATLDKIKTTMPAAMPASVATLQLKLKPLLDKFGAGSANPVSDNFTADHSGLDGVFDNVKVVIANGILTITNVDTGVVLFTAQVKVKGLEDGHFDDNDDDVPKPSTRPAAPTGVTAVGGTGLGQVTVSWDPVANATSYDLVFATVLPAGTKVADEDDRDDEHAKRIKNVTSPFVVTGLAASTTYFFIVRARISGRKGPASAAVSASPSGTTTTTNTGPTTSTTAGSTTTTVPGATTSTTAATTTTTAATTTTTAATTSTTAGATTTTTATTATTAPTTSTTASTTTTTLAALNGAALYATNCSGCHNPLATSEKRGRTATQITNAIASNRGGMGSIVLTPAQVTAIAAALL